MDQENKTVQVDEKKATTAQEPINAKNILSRALAPEQAPQETPQNGQISLDDIKDPAARSLMEKRLKELESGYNKKYEDLANKRKELEAKMSQSNAWSPERLEQALKDPTFVSLVQARQQQATAQAAPNTWEGSADEWSALTPEEKQQFAHLNNRLSAQEQMMSKMLQAEEDTKLKQTYPDYDPSVVDQIQQDLMSGKLIATREHLWKVANHDAAVERAYKLGLQDRKLELSDKLNASSSISTHNVTPTGEVPPEIKKQGFGAIARWRLDRAKSGNK